MPHSISCLKHGVDQQFLAPCVAQQNEVVEHKNRTLVEMARTMLDEHRAPRHFGAEAINTTYYILNKFFLHSLINLTPFEICFVLQPSVSHLRPFVANSLS
jgi:hypothetical protein